MKEPIISVSGLRGIIGESLTPDLAMHFACAFAAGQGEGPIVLSRDGRSSGEMLARSVQAGLNAIGRTVIDVGIAPTPTVGILVRHRQAAGGIQISASHNPQPYNGMKLFGTSGQVLDAVSGEAVVRRYRERQPPWVTHDRLGRVELWENTLDRHLELVLQTIDVAAIRVRRFRVLLDANHGAGGLLGRRLLEALSCEFTVLGDQPDGQFAHPPEPTAENLADIQRHVTEIDVDIGFCQDPDADRLAVIDEQGRYAGEEYTLALCLDHVLRSHRGAVVVNCASSRMSQDVAQQYECTFYHSAVGEANVVAAMQKHGAVFGGEGNGGPIDPRVGFVRDSFVGMALILDAMAARGKPVSDLVDELPRYEIEKTKVTLSSDNIPAALEVLERHFAAAAADRLDGLRLNWPRKWLLVRPSNTEPIVRVIAEAPTKEEAVDLCLQAHDVLRKSQAK